MTSVRLYILSIFFGVLQIADGLLTYIGVSRLGSSAEGNPLVRCFIDLFGPFQGILLVKLLGLTAVYIICVRCIRVDDTKWLQNFLISMISFYLIFAIIPWVYVLGRI